MIDNLQLSLVLKKKAGKYNLNYCERESAVMGKFQYDVALSFAGEQRKYVRQVSVWLDKLGISNFYDNNEKANLWGKTLTQYLQNVYFRDSRYFVPFITPEYLRKDWPQLEFKFALDRNMQEHTPDFQQYVLPVYFCDYHSIEVPGLPKSIGYVDGRKISPAELARLLAEKICGTKPPVPQLNRFGQRDVPATISSFHTEEFDTLKNKFSSFLASDIPLLLAFGEHGIGKRTLIRQLLHDQLEIFYVAPIPSAAYPYEPLVRALHCQDDSLFESNGLNFDERLMQRILSMCGEKEEHLFYFENVESYPQELFNYTLHITQHICSLSKHIRIKIIFEYDSNSGNDYSDKFLQFSPLQIQSFPISRMTSKDVRRFLIDELNIAFRRQEDIDYIISASCGNFLYLNSIINFLKMKEYLSGNGGQIVCREIPEGLLSEVLQSYILHRYHRLDPVLKDVLAKSTAIGCVFDEELLRKPFDIPNADQMLQKIEELSRLIKHEQSGVYTFDSIDSYNLISLTMSETENRKYHGILAEYFKRVLENQLQLKGKLRPKERLSFYHLMAVHYQLSGQYQIAVDAYTNLISYRMAMADYAGALADISTAQSLCDMFCAGPMLSRLCLMEAKCQMAMGRYEQSLAIFNQYKAEQPDKSLTADLALNHAYCLYMLGKNRLALEEALHVKVSLEKSEQKNAPAYYRVLSFCASIYDAIGNEREKKTYFIQTLNFCKRSNQEQEYYESLRKASMVFGEELSIPMYLAAADYFRANQQIKNLAETLHNLATDLLYLDRRDEISQPLQESLSLFNSYGSAMILYPLNTSALCKYLFERNFPAAITELQQALTFQCEPFSEITVRTNIAQCMLQEGNIAEAREQLELIDRSIERCAENRIPVYQVYHEINWALYAYHSDDLHGCHEHLRRCGKLKEIEPRFRYLQKQMLHRVRKELGLPSISTFNAPPKPILKLCADNMMYFVTVRFYE